MGKLVRTADGKVLDCFVVNVESNQYANNLKALYYENNKWNMETLSKFRPAVPGQDY